MGSKRICPYLPLLSKGGFLCSLTRFRHHYHGRCVAWRTHLKGPWSFWMPSWHGRIHPNKCQKKIVWEGGLSYISSQIQLRKYLENIDKLFFRYSFGPFSIRCITLKSPPKIFLKNIYILFSWKTFKAVPLLINSLYGSTHQFGFLPEFTCRSVFWDGVSKCLRAKS